MRWLVVLFLVAVSVAATTTTTDFVGEVRDLSVSLVSLDDGKQLKFNVSWLRPETREPSFYSTLVSSIPSNDSVCTEGSLYHVGDNVNQTSVLLPESRFAEEEAIDELDIEPGCSYKIQVFANPRSSHDAEESPSVLYHVPECIGTRCNCFNSSKILPKPSVTSTFFSNGSTLITWKVDPSSERLVEFYKISIGIPNLTSSSGLLVYNKTNLLVTNSTEFLWQPTEKPKRGTKIFVSAGDGFGCFGAEEATYASKRPRHTSFYRKNATVIMFAALVITCVLISGFVNFVKYLIKSHHKYKLVALGQKRPLASVLSNPKIEALLRNHNSLYVEHDVEDTKSVDPLEINFTRLREVRELGSGQFGRVYLADLQLEGDERRRLVAVKTSLDSQLEVRQQLLEEIAMIKLAGTHPHLVALVGYSTLPNHPVCIVLEYMRGGELLSYLHRMRDAADSNAGNDSLESPGVDSIAETTCTSLSSRSSSTARRMFFGSDMRPKDLTSGFDGNEGPISRAEMMRFALEIAMGMEHLEAKGIVHRDLAARNVLMDENLVLKICDFGLSRKGAYMLNGAGVRRLPIRWMPPEAIRRRAFTNKSDVWSYGLCLWEIATLGDFPYSRLSDDALLRHLLEENGRPDTTQLREAEMKELMEMCWASLPERRPNFGQIREWLESKRNERCKGNPMYMGLDILRT